MNVNKKNFDPTTCFTFFGSWLKSIEKLNNEHDEYLLFKAIAYYSMYDEEPEFEDSSILSALWALIEREIDISINRRKANFDNDELNEKRQKIIEALIQHPELSYREIGVLTGTNKDMVSRVKRANQLEIEKRIADIARSSSDVVVNGNDGDGVNDSDTMRRDTRQTMLQMTDEDMKQVTLLDRIQERLSCEDCIQIEINEKKRYSTRGKWIHAYNMWLKKIEGEYVKAILETYLSSHAETRSQKNMGNRYGRIIKGWNNRTQEPIVVYPCGYLPNNIQHNISEIPIDYYLSEDEYLDIEEERKLLEETISDELQYIDDELPF